MFRIQEKKLSGFNTPLEFVSWGTGIGICLYMFRGGSVVDPKLFFPDPDPTLTLKGQKREIFVLWFYS